MGIFATILIVTYPYTLKLTAPATIVINANLNTSGNVLVHGNRILRILRDIGITIFSGAKALAINGPSIASTVTSRGVVSLTTSTRLSSARPLSLTILGCTSRGNVGCRGPSDFGGRSNGNMVTGVNASRILMKGTRFLGSTKVSATGFPMGTRGFVHSNGSIIFVTMGNRYGNLLTVSSALGDGSRGALASLGGRKVGAMVLSNSGHLTTRFVNGRINTSGICTRILPSNGTRVVGRVHGGCNAILVINSNVGSTITLSRTSINYTIKGNDSVTVRDSSIILVGSSVSSIKETIGLDHLAVEGVGRGLF